MIRVRPSGRVLGGIDAAVVAVAASWPVAYLYVSGPDGWRRPALVAVAVLVGLGAYWVASVAMFERPLLVTALYLAGGASLMLASTTAVDKTLTERGRISACVVEEERGEVVMAGFPDPASPGDMFETEYHYRLRCPGGAPDAMQASTSVATPGATVRIIWDPAGRIGPRRADGLAPLRATVARGSWVIGGLVVLLLLLDVALFSVSSVRR
ncbi:hypothetical protein [Spongiactinospora sp. TRM90649]|uniref:hypothetical protein n=1 Tax=Spongiactinospora sp. TRM90649 TaxID=3031114 RepID=UPI0023F6CFA1|nr:hypothetical protein [Spongiactinospora sp. TRM90649]MDF5755753.1 hypothetical protein [Spongiactinospora sp. TRM90649]